MNDSNRPWDLFDKFLGFVLNFFAAVGNSCQICGEDGGTSCGAVNCVY